MVKRLQEMKRSAIIVDLDGTLLRGNSMRMFMRHLPCVLFRRMAPLAAVQSLWWIGLRSLRAVSHKTMKWHLTKIAKHNLQTSDWEMMAKEMTGFINPNIKEFIETRQKKLSDSSENHQSMIIIASAAMEEYVVPLNQLLGYGSVIATEFSTRKSEYVEKRGEIKLKYILNLLEKENMTLDTFLTDHYDDCPTAEAFPERTIIVNPKEEHEALFREKGIKTFYRESQRGESCR